MKLNLLVLLSITTVCYAQLEPQVAELQESLMQCEVERADNLDRINQFIAKLKSMDEDIESDITKALEFAQRYMDSAETGGRIMDTKKSILKDLNASIERYTELEKKIADEIALNQGHIKEDMIKIRDWADAKILRRIQQLADITVSLGGYEYYTGGRFGDDDSYDYAKAKRLGDSAEKNKLEVIDKINAAIDKLSERSDELEEALENLPAAQPREDMDNHLRSVKEKIAALEGAIEAITTREATGKQVGKDASRATEKEMRKWADKIESSANSFFDRLDELMMMLIKQKSLNTTIEKYQLDIEQLKAGS